MLRSNVEWEKFRRQDRAALLDEGFDANTNRWDQLECLSDARKLLDVQKEPMHAWTRATLDSVASRIAQVVEQSDWQQLLERPELVPLAGIGAEP